MGFGQAISSGFSNYVNFSDRACRSEFWFWMLAYYIGLAVVAVIDYGVLGTSAISGLYMLAVFLPTLAVGIRRLHDLDRTGWWILLGLIPLIGPIILIVWFCSRGTAGPNRFGPDPLGAIAASMPRAA
jgi:uncharacterized membrane protein YhaH (DUF805 family)